MIPLLCVVAGLSYWLGHSVGQRQGYRLGLGAGRAVDLSEALRRAGR